MIQVASLLSDEYDQFCSLLADQFVMHAQVNFFGMMMYSQREEAANQVINQLVVVISQRHLMLFQFAYDSYARHLQHQVSYLSLQRQIVTLSSVLPHQLQHSFLY